VDFWLAVCRRRRLLVQEQPDRFGQVIEVESGGFESPGEGRCAL